MYCWSCAHQNPTGAKFCAECGASLVAATPTPAASTPAPKPTVPPKQTIIVQKRSTAQALLLLLLICGGSVGMLLFVLKYQVERQKNWIGQEKPIVDVSGNDSGFSGKINLPTVRQRPQRAAALEAPTATYTTTESASSGQRIPPASFTVQPGHYFSSHFNVSGRGHLSGSFAASSDLNVYVVDEEGYANIRGGFRSYYSSGRVVAEQIDLHLAPGSYYLVFDNSFSILTGKNVNANIILED
jgi:hypothetical protein